MATEGLAILAARIASVQHVPGLHAAASAFWIASGLAYAVIGYLLVRRAPGPA